MSDQPPSITTPQPAPAPGESPQPRRRSLGVRIARGFAWIGLLLLLLVAVLLIALTWYSKTPDFDRRVRVEVVKVLEDSTGGKVEIGHISVDLWHLAIEVDNLVIHGLEAPRQAPYLRADKLLLHLKINTILSHTVGKGPQSHIGLNLLRVEEPQVHLIIDKDGKTNQPTPRKPSTSTEPLQDTLLDLQAKEAELVNGLVLVNDKAIPLDADASDLQATVKYVTSSDRYRAVIDLNNLRTQVPKEPVAQSRLHLEAQLGRDMASVDRFDFRTGANSELQATAAIQHFSKPEWRANVDGSLALPQIAVLGGVEGLDAGSVELHVGGHNCQVEPAVAQRKPHFWQRSHPKDAASPSLKTLPPSPECTAGYLLVGGVKLHDAGYHTASIRLHNFNASAQLHVTPTELLLTTLTGYLAGGGSATGELRVSNWLGEVPPSTPAKSATTVAAAETANKVATGAGARQPVQSVTLPPVEPAHAILKLTVNHIPLRALTAIAGSPKMHDLGFDTTISGPVNAEWSGPVARIADSLVADADLQFAPTGVRPRYATANIPVRGQVLAHYEGANETVTLRRALLQTPASTIDASGTVALNQNDPRTNLRLDAQVTDLGEFDQLLASLGAGSKGKSGTAALPVVLHGAVSFNGTARGPIRDIDVKGHLQAANIEFKPNAQTDVLIDSVVADAEYTASGVTVANSTIKRQSAVLNVSGAFKPRRVVRRGVVSYVWDDGTTIDAQAKLTDAQVTDVLQLAGQAGKYDLTGIMNVNLHAAGTLKALSGGGQVTLTNGEAYGEPYESAVVQATVAGKQIEASSIVLRLHGMEITGNGGYNLASERIHAHLEGDNLRLSKFKLVQQQKVNADGVLSLRVDANGTVKEPGLRADLKLADATYNGQALGQLTAEAHSQGSTVFYTADSNLVGTKVALAGQTALTGDYLTQAKLTLTGLDIGKAMSAFSTSTLQAKSSINGVVTVNGPAKKPALLTATAEFQPLDVTVQGYELKADGPVRIAVQNGLATLAPLHLTGPDTDLRAGGTAQVLGVSNPRGGELNLTSSGSVNVALLHTFDRDVSADGRVQFQVVVGGRLKHPVLTGNIDLEKVDLAYDGIPNGLTNLTGRLSFNEDRLEVRNLTATTGGGLLKVGGFLTYRNGLYADLSATADATRVRLYGLSTTANTSLRLQGSKDNLLLSGNVLITRFGVGPDVDFAAFAGSGGVSAPPDPNAITNKIRMDIHVQSSPQLDFQNSYAKLAGTVDLTVRGTVAQPSVLGRIQITDGSATFAGTKYQVQRGTIYFTNPVRIDPLIDLDVTARVENYDITISLHGTTSNLKPTYRSEPPLSEADVFALLALGRTQEEAQLYQEQQVQAGTDPTTSALLGGALNATVSNRVSKLFGGGSVKIDPAFVGTLGNSSARITVQQQLSQQLSVTFATSVNSSAQQLISVQYALDQNQSIVATRDETGVFSIVYKLRKRYR